MALVVVSDLDPDELTDGEALEEEVAEVAAVAAGQSPSRRIDVDESVEHVRLAVDADLVVLAGVPRRRRGDDVGRFRRSGSTTVTVSAGRFVSRIV